MRTVRSAVANVLTNWLLERASSSVRRAAAEHPQLESALEAIAAGARTAWPEFAISDETFFHALGERLTTPSELESLRTTDLFFAIACLESDAKAVAAFDGLLRAECERAARRSRGELEASDLFSALRVRLLFDPRSLKEYAGQGSLKGWLGSVVVRSQLNAMRSKRRAEGREQAASDSADTEAFANPELELMRARYRGAFNEAFRTALSLLEDQDRALLRLNVVEGLGLDRLARLKNVGRSTAARWLAAARQRLLEETRRQLMARLGVGESTLDSLLPLMKSDIDVSIRSALDGVT